MVRSCSRSGVKSTSSFGSYASGWMPSSCVLYSPNRLMCSVRYGEMCARSSGSIFVVRDDAAVAEADPLGEPVERLHLVGRRSHPPTKRCVGEVAQELDGADHAADLAERGVRGVLPRPGAQPLEQRGGGNGALAHGDGHAHQVAELGLDQVEVDDVLARLTEQGVDVHVLRLLGGPVEGQFLPVPDVSFPLSSRESPGVCAGPCRWWPAASRARPACWPELTDRRDS